ncbi:MAG: T9SS type A sorting domain-containing protein [Bacteroidetes bacterium]|nr:T9SS type A sorting domain-containing protein [Bacteroidota bacterium]
MMHCGGGSCDTLFNSPTLGVLNSIINNPFSVYPNPASDLVSVINPGNIEIDAVIVYDLNGKQINYATSPLNFINVGELNSGLYIVKIISRESSFSVKLMVN